MLWSDVITTLLGTNISHPKAVGKMNFLFPSWDMLVSRRVMIGTQKPILRQSRCIKSLMNQLRNKMRLMEWLLHHLGMCKNLLNIDMNYFAPHSQKDHRMFIWLIVIAHSWLGYDLAHPLQESEMEIILKKARYFVYKILDDWLGLTRFASWTKVIFWR